MKCFFVKLLYKSILPVSFKGFLLNRFYEECYKEDDLSAEEEKMIRSELGKHVYEGNENLWDGVLKKISLEIQGEESSKKAGIHWLIPSVALILLLFAFFIGLKITTDSAREQKKVPVISSAGEVEIQILEADGKKAKPFYFNSKYNNRLIVWVKKNQED